uniref:Uncharacterized protein n=1 Tax=Anopheles minimus TaxID=112268 RepID=A0A182WQB1_9DIPT
MGALPFSAVRAKFTKAICDVNPELLKTA